MKERDLNRKSGKSAFYEHGWHGGILPEITIVQESGHCKGDGNAYDFLTVWFTWDKKGHHFPA